MYADYLWKWLQKHNPGVGVNVNAGSLGHAGFNINAGNPGTSGYYTVPSSSDDFYTVQNYEGPSYYVDSPATYAKYPSDQVSWGSTKKR